MYSKYFQAAYAKQHKTARSAVSRLKSAFPPKKVQKKASWCLTFLRWCPAMQIVSDLFVLLFRNLLFPHEEVVLEVFRDGLLKQQQQSRHVKMLLYE